MNSTISDDSNREHFAKEAAKYIENYHARSQNINLLHKELLEVNLSIIAYIEDSKRRLAGLRLALANDANSSQKVVEILSEKCKTQNMSNLPASPRKRNTRSLIKSLQEDNNNSNKFSEHQKAQTFTQWYKHMIDNDRQNLTLYLSDDVIFEWFGRTIKSRKKVSSFLKHDMQCSHHDFTTVERIDKIQSRQEKLQRREEDTALASPLTSPELVKSKPERPGKRRLLRSNCNSPEWADSCKPDDEFKCSERKKFKSYIESPNDERSCEESRQLPIKRLFSEDEESEITNKGDGMLGKRAKRKCVPVTPPNCEVGQGDCLPSTSGTDCNKSHDTLNAQLPKLAVECNGYIEFNRTKNNRRTDGMKWERKCKVQISYSEDPLNIGEYIIWELHYTDESKCRRNLLAAFEEVAIQEGLKTA